MIKKITYIFMLLLTLFSANSFAQISIENYNGNIYVENATTEELENFYKQHKYQRFHFLKQDEFPAIFVKTFPKDFQQIESQKYRNELFIRILTPLALKINEEIDNERSTLLRLERNYKRDKSLTPEEIEKLEELAKKYDFFTRSKDNARIEQQIKNLKTRIDIIPPSILVATAAIESNWGFSRLANVANSLYKEKLWYTTEGLEPLENKDDGYRFKIFDSLIESMRSFALTFNSHINYATVWEARKGQRARRGFVYGESIAYTLAISSNLPNFAGILDYTTAFYDLYSLDKGKLKRIE
ncbi:MAG: glucosaminidase domain-containing protein [Alphaproteobacteria bacterium]|nr:glucosaminidase domain-containing protein [Alphaproteobacteria bacterium]